jgi:hypothetical protein
MDLATEARAVLGPAWLPLFDDWLETFTRDPDQPLNPWEGPADPPFSRCGVFLSLGFTVNEQVAQGAAADVRAVLGFVEQLLERHPRLPVKTRGGDDSIWNGVGACFLETVLPAGGEAFELLVGNLGPITRSVAAWDPWMLEPKT